jgi:ATP-dependent Zn protease
MSSRSLSYSEFIQRVDAGQVQSVSLDGERIVMHSAEDVPQLAQQIGKELGISRQRVQQIEAGALRRLRKHRDLRGLMCG